MFVLGFLMKGHLFTPERGEWLTWFFSFLDLGIGLPYFVCLAADIGFKFPPMQPAVATFFNFSPKWTSNWLGYIVDVVRRTRTHEAVLVGGGPRATQALLLASRAHAAIAGRDFATPDDVKAMAAPVLEHRLVLRPEYEIEGLASGEVIERILQDVAVPR
jgi:MoxR-like ATPase